MPIGARIGLDPRPNRNCTFLVSVPIISVDQLMINPFIVVSKHVFVSRRADKGIGTQFPTWRQSLAVRPVWAFTAICTSN